MFLVMGLGPLEEKEATNGADVSFASLLLKMVAVGLLHHQLHMHACKRNLINLNHIIKMEIN